ncbi:UNVERIFIED_CONTAM: hypothetical protein K2H54_003325 [Gekko kuhli]
MELGPHRATEGSRQRTTKGTLPRKYRCLEGGQALFIWAWQTEEGGMPTGPRATEQPASCPAELPTHSPSNLQTRHEGSETPVASVASSHNSSLVELPSTQLSKVNYGGCWIQISTVRESVGLFRDKQHLPLKGPEDPERRGQLERRGEAGNEGTKPHLSLVQGWRS